MQFMQIKKYNIWLQWLKQLTWWKMRLSLQFAAFSVLVVLMAATENSKRTWYKKAFYSF